jgi:hypothetical protein
MPQFGIREAHPPNTALELTPLCGPKIVAILTARFCSTAFPICWCGAAQRRAVGRAPSAYFHFNKSTMVYLPRADEPLLEERRLTTTVGALV